MQSIAEIRTPHRLPAPYTLAVLLVVIKMLRMLAYAAPSENSDRECVCGIEGPLPTTTATIEIKTHTTPNTVKAKGAPHYVPAHPAAG